MPRPIKIYITSHVALVREVAEELSLQVVDNLDESTIHWCQERLKDAANHSKEVLAVPASTISTATPPYARPSTFPPPPSPAQSNKRALNSSVIPGLGQAVTKDALNSSLEAFRLLMGRANSRCAPRTFCLPSQLNLFEEYLDKTSSSQDFIYKPSCGSQGKGIHLFTGLKGWHDLKNTIQTTTVPESGRHDYVEKKIPRSVVQKYIGNPYLKLAGLKFDFRLYLLVESLDPLSIWLCDEGLVRFCTVPYQKFSSSSSSSSSSKKKRRANMCAHLSNYSVNKHNHTGYVHSSILDPNPSARSEGTKRTLTSVLREMRDMGEDVDQMMEDIKHLIVQTSAALQSDIILRSKTCQTTGGSSNGSKGSSTNSMGSSGKGNRRKKKPTRTANDHFQLLGFDVMVDDQLKPYLLEVNANPSLRTTFTKKTEIVAATANHDGEEEKEKEKEKEKEEDGSSGGSSSRNRKKTYVEYESIVVDSPVDKYIKTIVVKGALKIICKKYQTIEEDDNDDNEHQYTNLNANDSNNVRRASWITSRVRRFYERLCRGRNGLPCNIFCRSLRSILRLRGALVHSRSPSRKNNVRSKMTSTDTWLRPVVVRKKRLQRKRSGNGTSATSATSSATSATSASSVTTAKRRPVSARRKRRPVSAGRTRNQKTSFEAGELFLLFAKTTGTMIKGYTSLDTTMTFCQFVPALVMLAERQYPQCSDAVTALDTLLGEAEEAERQANETLVTSATSKAYSLGHLIVLKEMLDSKKKKEQLETFRKGLDMKLSEKRKKMTKTRLEKRRQEEVVHHKRRVTHEKHLKTLMMKSKAETEDKKRRQLEFKLWMATGGKKC